MIKIRVLHTDGIDELYTDVIKYIVTKNKHLIYTSISTFTIDSYDIEFIQAWDEESE